MTPKNDFRIEGAVVWIKLTQGKETCVDLMDWDKVKGYRWSYSAGRSTGYATTYSRDSKTGKKLKPLRLHWLILKQKHGFVVDHINGEGLDNRSSNLRHSTLSQNGRNSRTHRDSKSGLKGVRWDESTQSWGIQIRATGYDKPESAASAYNKVAAILFGSFAKLNSI